MEDDPGFDPEEMLKSVDKIIIDWPPDTTAVLCGLKHAVLNDMIVTVLVPLQASFEKGRVRVRLLDGSRDLAVLPENLRRLTEEEEAAMTETKAAAVAAPTQQAGNAVVSAEADGGYIQQTVQQVPVVGRIAGPILGSRLIRRFSKHLDPYAQGAVEAATPYVQGALQRPVVQRSFQIVQGTVSTTQSVAGAVVAVPGQVVHGVFSTTKAVAGGVIAVPGQVFRGAVATVGTVVATPGYVYRGVTSAPGTVIQRTVSTVSPFAATVADRAQPFVLSAVGIITPYVESAVEHPRVQSVYQHRVVQGSIERVWPYLTPVAQDPRIGSIAEAVGTYAGLTASGQDKQLFRPRAVTN